MYRMYLVSENQNLIKTNKFIFVF